MRNFKTTKKCSLANIEFEVLMPSKIMYLWFMNVVTYVSDLLYRYDCVILPEFGALLTQRRSATIQAESNTFYPPQKILSFNPQLQQNDGLLANYISGLENCSYTDALAKIQRFTTYLQEELQIGKQVQLDHIGTFYLAAEKTIQFEPEQQVNYLADSFGLSPITIPEIRRKIEREVLKEQVVTLEEKAPILITPEKRSQKQHYWKYAAAAALLLSFSFIGLKQYSNTVVAHNNSVELEVTEAVRNEVSKAGFVFETEDTLPVVSVLVTNNAAKGKYHIIAGAYRVPKNAEKKVLQLQRKGFDAYIMAENPYGLHQVVYESHEDKYEALRKLRKIKRTDNYNAWLFVQETK